LDRIVNLRGSKFSVTKTTMAHSAVSFCLNKYMLLLHCTSSFTTLFFMPKRKRTAIFALDNLRSLLPIPNFDNKELERLEQAFFDSDQSVHSDNETKAVAAITSKPAAKAANPTLLELSSDDDDDDWLQSTTTAGAVKRIHPKQENSCPNPPARETDPKAPSSKIPAVAVVVPAAPPVPVHSQQYQRSLQDAVDAFFATADPTVATPKQCFDFVRRQWNIKLLSNQDKQNIRDRLGVLTVRASKNKEPTVVPIVATKSTTAVLESKGKRKVANKPVLVKAATEPFVLKSTCSVPETISKSVATKANKPNASATSKPKSSTASEPKPSAASKPKPSAASTPLHSPLESTKRATNTSLKKIQAPATTESPDCALGLDELQPCVAPAAAIPKKEPTKKANPTKSKKAQPFTTARCQLCKNCPGCTLRQSHMDDDLQPAQFAKSNAAMECALVRQYQILLQTTDRYEQQTDAVRRKLKTHRRNLWQQKQPVVERTHAPRFLPDHADMQFDDATVEKLPSTVVGQATLRIFAKQQQPTLSQFFTRATKRSDETTDEQDETDSEESIEADGVNEEPVANEPVHENDACYQPNEPDEPWRVETVPVPFVQVKTGSSTAVWGLRDGFDCLWDRLFEDPTEANNNLSQLCQLLEDVDSTQGDDDKSLNIVDTSMLSQRGRNMAEDIVRIITNDTEKLATLESICPQWQENVRFAFYTKQEQEVGSALEGVKAARARLQMKRQTVLDMIQRQDAALEVYEMALDQSSVRFITHTEEGGTQDGFFYSQPDEPEIATQQAGATMDGFFYSQPSDAEPQTIILNNETIAPNNLHSESICRTSDITTLSFASGFTTASALASAAKLKQAEHGASTVV
jgi:hypothetical protein